MKLLRMCVWAMLLCCICGKTTVYGASGPGKESLEEPETYTAVDGYTISEEEKTDSVIEYWECGSLIHFYNTSVQEMVISTEDRKTEYEEIKDFLVSERDSARMDKEDAEEEGDMEEYAVQASLEEIYRSAIKTYNDSIKKLDKYSYNKNRIILERQLTNTAQNLMISLQSLSIQEEYTKRTAELYKMRYTNELEKAQIGMSTEKETEKIYNQWKTAENSLYLLEANKENISKNLCVLLGVDWNTDIVFGQLPSADMEKAESIKLEEDVEKAINNNVERISLRNTSSGKTTSGIENKERMVNAKEDEIRIQMQILYANIESKKQNYAAAQSGTAAARIQWENDKKQYSLGMLNHSAYLQKELDYIKKEAEIRIADLELFQALQTYEWAVRGIMS